MEEVVAEARRMIQAQRSVFELLEFLQADASFRCTPFNFLRVLHEAGISLVESRELMSMFDLDWQPGAPAAEIEQKWAAMIGSPR
jgi:hypothetical protein